MSWTDLQLSLLRALAAYESAERASAIVNDSVRDQWRKADALHAELTKVAMACGFEPGGRHRDLMTVDWAKQRVATISRTLHNHLKEARL